MLIYIARFLLLLSILLSNQLILAAEALPRPGNAHEFYFTRGIYSARYSDDYFGFDRWSVDYPKADQQFLIALKRLSNVDAYDSENALTLDNPKLRQYPFLYILEVGYMHLKEAEIKGLRDYLNAGGFVVIDDFWGTWAWKNLVEQMRKVLPDKEIIEIPTDHPVFNIFYNIDEIIQVPNVRQGQWSAYGGPTHEYDGIVPFVKGIFDDEGRLMVLVNGNTDLGDAWEWADDPYYPLKFSTYGFEIGVNFVLYGMTY